MKIIILAHEIGERLWPLTSAENPKALLPLYNENSMLIETILRCLPLCNGNGKDIYVVTTPEAKKILREVRTLSSLNIPLRNILTFKGGLPTSSIIYKTVQSLKTLDDSEVIVFTPADQFFWPEEGFIFHLSNTIVGAEKIWPNYILGMTLQPSMPTGVVNYIGADWKQVDNVGIIYEPPRDPDDSGSETVLSTLLVPATDYKLTPDYGTAETLVADGWLWDLHTWVSQMKNFRECIVDIPLEDMMQSLIHTDRFKATVATKVVWSLLDNWSALKYLTYDMGLFPPREDSRVHSIDSESNLVRKDPKKEVVLMGVSDLIIIDTPDRLLIATPGAAHEYL